jgi:hypothetical protein
MSASDGTEDESMQHGWGVDEPEKLKMLEEAARRKDRFAFRIFGLTAIILGFGTLFGIGRALMIGRPPGPFAVMPLAFVVVSAITLWERRRIRKHLAGVLEESGRCRTCGYNLRGLPDNRCPECGTSFEVQREHDETSNSRSNEL